MTAIITVSAAKSFLKITDSSSDTELSDVVDTASSLIAARIGPVAGSPVFDEWYDGGGCQIMLRHAPVQSVTSVTESYGTAVYTLTANVLDGGSGLAAYGYTLDAAAGILTRRSSGVVVPFGRGLLNVHVVYVGGYPVVPVDLQVAAKLLTKHLWSARRGGTRRGQSQDVNPQDFDDFPRLVAEILETYQTPGIA